MPFSIPNTEYITVDNVSNKTVWSTFSCYQFQLDSTRAQHTRTGNFCPFPASVSPPCGKGEAGLCFAGLTSQSLSGRLHEAGVQYI